MATASKDWLVVINPHAGRGQALRSWERVRPKLNAAGFRFDVRVTTRRGEATQIVQSGIERGHHSVLAVGGDGTQHEVINGIMRQQRVPSHELTATLLPVGTGNDWARTLQLPRRAEGWLSLFLRRKAALHNLAHLTFYDPVSGTQRQCYSVNVIGLAYDAYLVRRVETSALKQRGGWAYPLALLTSLHKYRPERLCIQVGDDSSIGQYYSVNIGVCRFSGGGMQLVPQANPFGTTLALTTVGEMPLRSVIRGLPLLFNGKIAAHGHVVATCTQKDICINHVDRQPALVEADGEFLGTTPVRIKLVPHAFRTLIP